MEVVVKHRCNFDEITQKINISNFKSNQLSLFEEFNVQFDLSESVEFNTQILFYNLKEIGRTIIEFEIHYLTGGCLFELIEDKENNEEVEEEIELQDFENFNEEVRDGCVRILEIINNNFKKYKITGKTKKKNLLELTNALTNFDFPDCEYLLEISYEVRNEKESESKHWSIELGCHAFIVESYVRIYKIEIGGDRFTSFYYSQNRNESYDIEGYFSTWFDELEKLLESQYDEELSIEISSNEFE